MYYYKLMNLYKIGDDIIHLYKLIYMMWSIKDYIRCTIVSNVLGCIRAYNPYYYKLIYIYIHCGGGHSICHYKLVYYILWRYCTVMCPAGSQYTLVWANLS